MEKKFLKFLSVVLFFGMIVCGKVFGASLQEIKQRGYIKVSTNAEFMPFEFREGEEILGIDIDIAKQIAKHLGVELKMNDVSFDALVLELINGNCDFAIAGMSKSEEKAKSVDFSNPYYVAKQLVLVPKNSTIKSSEDLNNKKLGVQLGTTGDIYCSENYKNSEIVRYNKISDASSDIISGELDAIIVDDLPAQKLNGMLGDSIRALSTPLFEESYRIAVAKGETEMLGEINNILEDMVKSGEIDRIVQKYVSSLEGKGEDLKSQIYNNLVNKQRYAIILRGLTNTIEITCVALIIGIILGVGVALVSASRSESVAVKILKFISKIYVLVIRGTPVVIQLFVSHYIIFSSSGMNKVAVAMMTFGINSGAYVSEIIRAGINAVDPGQYEAGRCLGLSERLTMSKIILPQAFRNILPTLMNEFIQLIKETSVAGFIGVVDLSRAGDIIRSNTYQPLVPLLSVAIIYFVLVSALTLLLGSMERKFKTNDKS